MVIYAINLCIPELCSETDVLENYVNVREKGIALNRELRLEVDEYLQVLLPLQGTQLRSLKVVVEKQNSAAQSSLDRPLFIIDVTFK